MHSYFWNFPFLSASSLLGLALTIDLIIAHESPYLNKFNTEALLQPGMTFTNEPGIYLLNRFGVRHEDIYLVKEDGEAELLSGRRATSPYDP